MTEALTDIRQFLAKVPAFSSCNSAALNELSKLLVIDYQPANSKLTQANTAYIVRTGAISAKQGEQVTEQWTEADLCALNLSEHQQNLVCSEDCLLYCISKANLMAFIANKPEVASYIHRTASKRLEQKRALQNTQSVTATSLLNIQIAQLCQPRIISIDINKTVLMAAKLMTQHKVSSLVITQNEQPIAIFTDKDIRQKVVAAGLATNTQLNEVIDKNLITIDGARTAFDALMMMTSHHIHHLPVTQMDKVIGMITTTDLMQYQGENALNLANSIRKATSVKQLATLSSMRLNLQQRMCQSGANADHVGRSLSAVSNAFTIRLIELAQAHLGEPPVPFAWLACGSQARGEQFAHSDQDNALIISNKLQPEHEYYFHDLAQFVCDGLAACGYIYCPGDIMASNSKWRQTQNGWQTYFNRWVTSPSPQALLNATVFFDLTTVYGDNSLLNEVKLQTLALTQQHSLFIAHLSKNALQHKPPLGFFRDFVLIPNGEHKASLDIKHNGLAPIVDLARIYALSEGISANNTRERLKQAAGSKSLTKSSAENLLDAFEFISDLRLEHQAKQIERGEKVDNYLMPKTLSKLEREHLKDAFKVIKELQDSRQTAF